LRVIDNPFVQRNVRCRRAPPFDGVRTQKCLRI